VSAGGVRGILCEHFTNGTVFGGHTGMVALTVPEGSTYATMDTERPVASVPAWLHALPIQRRPNVDIRDTFAFAWRAQHG
jgi:hypothetical protein